MAVSSVGRSFVGAFSGNGREAHGVVSGSPRAFFG